MRSKKSLVDKFSWSLLAICLLLAVGCTAQVTKESNRDSLPGGVAFFSMGQAQPKESFENIEIAQFAYSLYSRERVWLNLTPGRAPGMFNMFQSYVPLSVRWKLKDGREFILENIDIRSIMLDYFESHQIKMPWQQEGRPRAKSGDADPSLVFEVKNETVIIKWLITINNTPVAERFTSSGAATKWDRVYEESIVATLSGIPTQAIDFKKVWEFDCPGLKCKKE